MKLRSALFLVFSISLVFFLPCCKDTKTAVSVDFEPGQALPDVDIEFEYVDDIHNKNCNKQTHVAVSNK